MINRHPLQAQGAGQAERLLPNAAVVPYCDALGTRLSHFANVIGEERTEGRISTRAAEATQAFLAELRATIMVLALKHGRQLLDTEPLPLTIDPTESGMPTFKDFWQLRADCEQAQTQLAAMPTAEEIVDEAINTIYQRDRPIKQQMLWLQRAYLARLAETPVVADFRSYDPVWISNDQRGRLYSASWTGVIRSLNLFECTTMHFVERKGWYAISGVEILNQLIAQFEDGRHTLPEMIGLCNEAGYIVPQTIERVTIGPYHHQWTANDEFVQRAFNAANNGDAWMLRATIERVATTKAADRSFWDGIFGREPMQAGPEIKSTVLLVPLSIKQHLGDADEDGNVCAVYGVSQDGDLVC